MSVFNEEPEILLSQKFPVAFHEFKVIDLSLHTPLNFRNIFEGQSFDGFYHRIFRTYCFTISLSNFHCVICIEKSPERCIFH